MSYWQDFALGFYALTLAVLANALLWALAAGLLRLVKRQPPATSPTARHSAAAVKGLARTGWPNSERTASSL